MGDLGELPWLIGLHDDFPSAAALAARVRHPVLLDPSPTARLPVLALPAVAYGPMRAMLRVARDPQLAAAMGDDYARLRCSAYYPYVWRFLGRAAVLVPLVALATLDLARMFGPRVFVRSDTNFKLFTAEVHDAAAVAVLSERHAIHADALVVVSEVIAITAEYRCFCHRGQFVCGSSYPAVPYAPVPAAMRAFAEEIAAAVAPLGLDPLTVDVAETPDGPRLVELGGVHAWGLYGSDPAAFVAMMEAAARDRL
ncbi:MAG: ATP-grasp domain-containing protein [Deltaproteobacteria bacterium]|nr:ATP-grasp domain-containing protein [Deltaproteobacteria bacterium]